METIVTAILLVILLWILLSIVVWSLRTGISPMPTNQKVKKALLNSLPGNIQGPILELGSGWGSLAAPLAKKYPDNQVIGYELSPIPYLFSRLHRMKNLHFHRQDFFEIPLKDAGIIVCYLYPEAMRKLKEKFHRELSPNTLIVSHTFAIPGWTPIKTIEVGDIYKTKIYHYRVI